MIVVLLIAGWMRWRGHGRAAAAVIAVALLGSILNDDILKPILHRPRPECVAHWGSATGWSLPSGHAAGSVTSFGFALMMIGATVERTVLRHAIYGAAIGLVAAIGLSRIVLGVHWPSDVLAGWLSGLVVAALGWAWVRGRRHHGIGVG